MHFLVRQLLRIVGHISRIIIFLQALSLLLLFGNDKESAIQLLALSFILIICVCVIPLGQWLCIFLENRFPQPKVIPEDATGIILCGSGFDQTTSLARGQPCYNSSIGRLIDFVRVAQFNPKLRLCFTGGGAFTNKIVNESKLAKDLFLTCGLDVSRIEFETQARDTIENAVLSYKMVKPLPQEKWVLMTSSFHLPRAVGLFQKAGWINIIPYPVDFNTAGSYRLINFDFEWGFSTWRRASHEFLEMFSNYIFGYSESLIPGPQRQSSNAK
jgi:uncharacterized SAM-binding protein YcdF (DUF218 family)